MQTKEIINDLRDIATVLRAIGDLRKAKVLNRAADRLEQLEAARAGRDTSASISPNFID